MRLAAFVVLGLMTAALPRPAAAAYNLPWCAQYFDRSAIRSCAFATHEQCMATISGIGGYCIQNATLLIRRDRGIFPNTPQLDALRQQARDGSQLSHGAVRVETLGIALFTRVASDDPTALIGLPLIALCDMLAAEGVALLQPA